MPSAFITELQQKFNAKDLTKFKKCKIIPKMQFFHCVEPDRDFKLKMKVFSACDDFEILSFWKSELKRKSSSPRRVIGDTTLLK